MQKLIEWQQQKDFQRKMKEGWEKRTKQMEELDKEQKKAMGKRAFINWLKDHCEKLKVKKSIQSQIELENKIKEEKKEKIAQRRKQMNDYAHKQWLKDIKRRESKEKKATQRRSSFDYGVF